VSLCSTVSQGLRPTGTQKATGGQSPIGGPVCCSVVVFVT